MRKITYFIIIIGFVLFLTASCGEEEKPVPIPILNSLSPSYSVTRMPPFTLKVTGAKFINNSKIVFNGIEKDTTYISNSELNCTISYSDLPLAGISTLNKDDYQSAYLGDSSVPVLVRNPSPGGGDSNIIQFSILSNHTFVQPKNISQSALSSDDPDMAVDTSGNINVVWVEYQADPRIKEIYFSRSSDNGTTWSTFYNLSSTNDISLNPRIVTDPSNNICVVWQEWVPSRSEYDIYFKRSTDGGSNWSAAINISDSYWSSSNPAAVVDSAGGINVIWQERIYKGGVDRYELLFSRSTDNGVTWGDAVKIAESLCEAPIKIAANSIVGLDAVWRHYSCSTPGQIYSSRSTDNGATWSTPYDLSHNYTDSILPDITIDYLGQIYVVWKDEIDGNPDIYFIRSIDYGNTWSEPVNISNNDGISRYASLQVDIIRNLNVVWMDRTPGNYDIYYSRSINGGLTWTQGLNISGNAGDSMRPKICVNAMGYLFIIWIDKTDGNMEIYFNRSRISGID